MRSKAFLLFILLTVIFLNLVILSYRPDLWWDEAVYVSIGKYIFSFGNAGLFEILRPPVLPLFLGFVWFLGFNPVGFGKLISLISHASSVCLIYLLVKETYGEDKAILSSAFFAFTPFVYMYSTKILTGLPSGMFALISLYFFLNGRSKGKLLLSGIFSGLAFLTRFPAGLVFGGLVVTLCLKYLRKPEEMIKNLFIVFTGFLIIVTPYLLYNLFAYGSPLLPFLEASRQIESTPWFHNQDPLFYIKQLPMKNLFFIFSVLGLVYFFKKKDFGHTGKLAVLITFILFLLYFHYLEAKNIRFSLLFLPYLSIFSAYGVHEVIAKFAGRWVKYFVILILLISGILGVYNLYDSQIKYLRPPDPATPYHKFIEYFRNNPVTGTVITSNAMIGAYIDNKLISLVDWKLARKIYDSKRGEASLLAVDTCAMVCKWDDEECLNSRREFVEYLKKNEIVKFHEESESCNYFVFEIK